MAYIPYSPPHSPFQPTRLDRIFRRHRINDELAEEVRERVEEKNERLMPQEVDIDRQSHSGRENSARRI